ncbi:hypothetical protein [Chitinophaga costaii]|uniref:hypothetical protein n=1 Tax=Chitinophaga costaii TaxID=1335309 RepID=UPI0013FD1339|nr:hypothetical protein [Chitinophaga costaii]
MPLFLGEPVCCYKAKDIRTYTLQHLRTRISLVLQQYELFSGTIKQNPAWCNAQSADA